MYISVDLALHEIICAKVGKGDIMYNIFEVFLVYFTLIFPKMNQLLLYPISLATSIDVKLQIHPTHFKTEMV